MAGEVSYEMGFSKFTMALLEDSGWYLANYELAEPAYWGKWEGCVFITENCQSSRNFIEFCYMDDAYNDGETPT